LLDKHLHTDSNLKMTCPNRRNISRIILITALFLLARSTLALAGQYKNFAVAVYIPVGITRSLADPERLQDDWNRLSAQVKIDKVYLETYRDHQWADEETIEPIKKFFAEKGVRVSGGITLAAGGRGGQFGTFDYEDPKDREECRKAVEMAARHYDEIILDDFFFYTTKSDADIAAKGNKSWTDYRMERMREVARTLVVGAAKTVNPNAKVIIKYPNWYEHFQGLGFDLEQEPNIFAGIYTGTETRDPAINDQHLQAYESYEIIRYFNNIAPGRNGGGWVDTFSIRYPDRYAEQLVDTMFAKAPEITLFNWGSIAREPAQKGDRPWSQLPTSFNFDALVKAYQPPPGIAPEMTWARVAGDALEQVDRFIGKLGQPIGIASYKPFHSTGEDFLPHYLGMIGLPIELQPTFPTQANLVLLTESAKFDSDIVAKIKGQLTAGKNVVITSGLLKALQGKGIEDIVELRYTDRIVAVHDYLGGYGAGAGTALAAADQNSTVLIPEIRFLTNDAWQLIQGVSSDQGFPILLMDRYSKGILYVLTIPENQGDLYHYPQPVLSAIKRQLLGDFPAWIDAPAKVCLFAYDNHTFIVESFLPEETTVTVSLSPELKKLHDLISDQDIALTPQAPTTAPTRRREMARPRSMFTLTIKPHSYRVFEASN
jgi:hypothetical protein